MLHDPHHMNFITITDRSISASLALSRNWSMRTLLFPACAWRCSALAFESLSIDDDLIRWPPIHRKVWQERIANFFLQCVQQHHIIGHTILWIRYSEFLSLSEKLPLSLCSVHIRRCSYDLIPWRWNSSASLRAVCPPNCTMTLQVFQAQWSPRMVFPEYVRSKVCLQCQNPLKRLRIAIDHDGFMTCFFNGEYAMHATIINSIPWPILLGPDPSTIFFLVWWDAFIFLIKAAIK